MVIYPWKLIYLILTEAQKKVKIETFSPICERITRSRAVVNTNDIQIEKNILKKDENTKISPSISILNEVSEFSIEKKIEKPRQIIENNFKQEKTPMTSQSVKGSSFSSTIKPSILQKNEFFPLKSLNEKNSKNLVFCGKKTSPTIRCSKFVKKTTISSKIKPLVKIGQKSVSDSTNDGFLGKFLLMII